ncbi:MAG: dienelactone hydrolase family protein, partial [Acidobacteriota bacterium]
MKNFSRLALSLLLLLSTASTFAAPPATPAAPATPATPAAAHAPLAAPAAPAVPVAHDPNLPPTEVTAKAQLDKSPRHGEYVDIALPGGGKLNAWVVYPERKDKAGVVILIHEIYGLSDWFRGVADQLAKEGFIAVAPDLISGMGPNGGGTASAASRDDVVALVRGLTPEVTTARLNA